MNSNARVTYSQARSARFSLCALFSASLFAATGCTTGLHIQLVGSVSDLTLFLSSAGLGAKNPCVKELSIYEVGAGAKEEEIWRVEAPRGGCLSSGPIRYNGSNAAAVERLRSRPLTEGGEYVVAAHGAGVFGFCEFTVARNTVVTKAGRCP